MGMPFGMSDLLAQKYAIMQQQADSQSTAAKAAANLDMVRAGLMPKESAANIENTGANTMYTREQTKFFGPTALAGIGLTKAQTGLANAGVGETQARTGLIGAQTSQIEQLLKMYGLGENAGVGGWGLPAGLGSRRQPTLGF